MTRSVHHPGLNRFAWLTAGATFVLIGIGGLVTSKGAGMAVPDWPTTYGYNMFLFPIHLWTGGIFYEHSHRLFASFVGLLTMILAAWLWVRDSRRWLRWLGVAAFVAVVLQGVLGGLRVTWLKDEIGIVHAALAQAFLVLVTVIALFASGRLDKMIARLKPVTVTPGLRRLIVGTTLLIFLQLIIGASMRHQHAGLAVPDFPLAYGELWPPMDAAFLDRVNRQRIGIHEYKPITSFQVALHMTHRIVAVLILMLAVGSAWLLKHQRAAKEVLFSKVAFWLGLIVLQACLGAATVWTNKAADVATAHVLLGALSLLWGAVLSLSLLGATSEFGKRPAVQLPVPSGAALSSANPALR